MKKIINKTKDKLKKTLLSIKKFDYRGYYNENKLMIIFILTSLINAMLLRFLTIKNYFDIQPVLCDFIILVILSSFSYLIKKKNRIKYFFFLSILFTLICIINSMYYTNYLSFASISLFSTAFQVVDVVDAVYENILELKDFCYIWQIVAISFAYFNIKKKEDIKKSNKREKNKFLNTLIFGILSLGLFALTLSPTDIGRITKQWNRNYIISKYGVYAYQISDAIFSVTPKITSIFGYDKNYKMFRDYYNEKNPTIPNNYTNIFEGKNILVIHAESIQAFTMQTSFNGIEVTPNLNRLANEGIYFSNFYAQESVGTSSDSEFTFNTSLLPSSTGTIAINHWESEYETIEKLLKQKGYYTFSMHGNNCSFWNRNLLHQQFGYDKFYCYTNDYVIDEEIGLGLSDKSFFNQSVPKIEDINNNHSNWYGLLIMLSNHTPFSDIDGYTDYEVDYKYETIDEKTGKKVISSAPYLEGTVLGNYIKSVHYADEALGQLMQDLDESGLLDNTVVVIYGDHDAKIKKSEYERFYNYDYKTDTVLSPNDLGYIEFDSIDYELNRKVPFIIWSKDMDPTYSKEVTEVMGMYDVLPTLANMLNIKPNYNLGSDIFSKKDNIVIFPDSSWITNDIYYESSTGKIYNISKNNNNIIYSQEYIDEINKMVEEKLVISNSIALYDLIKQANLDNSVECSE
ncbi:MAG: LTA synthase family protein [Clostridium sp.]|nr:LTA synthase family protein [Clostridium sp.]MCM1444111.1 LTA synthase family protein [Candidatus Amulumruptor caecigallinarius]